MWRVFRLLLQKAAITSTVFVRIVASFVITIFCTFLPLPPPAYFFLLPIPLLSIRMDTYYQYVHFSSK